MRALFQCFPQGRITALHRPSARVPFLQCINCGRAALSNGVSAVNYTEWGVCPFEFTIKCTNKTFNPVYCMEQQTIVHHNHTEAPA